MLPVIVRDESHVWIRLHRRLQLGWPTGGWFFDRAYFGGHLWGRWDMKWYARPY
jgi:hypothetical protein